MDRILITGTGKGLGGAIAAYYLERGHAVYGINRSINRDLEKYTEFYFLKQDLSLFDEMEKTIPPFLEKAGELDLAILNAGILPEIKDMKECSLEEMYRVMDVNLWSNKVLIDLMFANLKTIRQIAAVSSGASVYGNRGWNAYSISKAALNMLIKLYSQEQPGTHFCSIAPGLIDTKMQEYIYSLPGDRRFPSIDRLKNARSSGQMPKPEEAAKTLAQALEKVSGQKSGSFVDVREM